MRYNGDDYTQVSYKMVEQIAKRVTKTGQLYQAEASVIKLLHKPGKIEMHALGSE